jgi:lipopolysaccharide transport protein LptA
MKTIFLITLIVLTAGLTVRAQTNSPVASHPPTQIDSDSAEFDIMTRKGVYRGHVHVTDPQMKLQCALLTATLPQSGGRVDLVVAETNVLIDFSDEKGQAMHTTSDKAVYQYEIAGGRTNETVTLSGHAMVENEQGWLFGEPIIWDRASNRLTASNQRMVFRQNLNTMTSRTNSTSVRPSFPPGTIQNIDRMNISRPQLPP